MEEKDNKKMTKTSKNKDKYLKLVLSVMNELEKIETNLEKNVK